MIIVNVVGNCNSPSWYGTLITLFSNIHCLPDLAILAWFLSEICLLTVFTEGVGGVLRSASVDVGVELAHVPLNVVDRFSFAAV